MLPRAVPAPLGAGLLAGLLVALAAGCGGGAAPRPVPSLPPAPVTASPSPAPGPVELPLTADRATAVAADIVLRAADLPGTTAQDVAPDAPQNGAGDPLAACLAGTGQPLATSESAGFSRGAPPSGSFVANSTDVVATTAQARADFAALTAPRVLDCLDAAAPKEFGGAVRGSFRRVPTTAPPGADGAARYVLDGVYTGGRSRYGVRLGLEAVLVGRAEVSLFDVAYGTSGLSGRDRDRLVGLLVRRAQSAQHLKGS